MRTYRGKGPKFLLLAVVIVMTLGFTIGMAAVITDSLVIKSKLSVNPNENLRVVFSSNPNKVVEGDVAPYSLTPTPSSTSWFKASDALIENSSIPTISNFQIQFEEPGNKVVYQFYAINVSDTDAYLTSILFNNADGRSTNKYCKAITGTTNDVSSLCNYINLKVTVGNETATSSKTISDHVLAAGSSELITITVEFSSSASITSDMGDFIVEFGDISLTYSDNSTGTGDSEVETGSGSSETPIYASIWFTPEIVDLDLRTVESSGGYDIILDDFPSSYLYFSNLNGQTVEFDSNQGYYWPDGSYTMGCEYYGITVLTTEDTECFIINFYTTLANLNSYGTTSNTTCHVLARVGDVETALKVGITLY